MACRNVEYFGLNEQPWRKAAASAFVLELLMVLLAEWLERFWGSVAGGVAVGACGVMGMLHSPLVGSRFPTIITLSSL